jgi:hypothetical protein
MDKNGEVFKPRSSKAVSVPTSKTVDNTDKVGYNSLVSKTDSDLVSVCFSLDAVYKITTPAGTALVFRGAGSQVKVSQEDANYLIGLTQGAGCCGGQTPTPLFVKV